MECLTDLKKSKTSLKAVNGFYGCQCNDRADGSKLFKAENVSDRSAPSVRPRNKRALLGKLNSTTCFLADETVCWVENGEFFYGGEKVSGIELMSGEKRLFRLGNYIIIFPDAVYYNIYDSSDFGTIYFSRKISEEVTVDTVDKVFNRISPYQISAQKPEVAEAGNLWGTSDENGRSCVKLFNGYAWINYEVYTRLSAPGIGLGIKPGDTLECPGIDGIFGSTINVVYADTDNIYCDFVVLGIRNLSNFTLNRSVPVIDYMTVSGGRLWGCRYGYDRNRKFVSKVYASAPDNPFLWNEAGGAISEDIGGKGEFTGISDYLGAPVIFRENSITEIKFSAGKIMPFHIECEGLEKGGNLSPVTVNGALYYKSRYAICEYKGETPKRVSDCIADAIEIKSGGAPAGRYNGKYYVKLFDKNGVSHIYVYNTLTKMWSIEDDPGVLEFSERNGNLYALYQKNGEYGLILWDYDNASEEAKNYFFLEGYPIPEKEVGWFFETGKNISESSLRRCPSRLLLRVRVGHNASINLGCIYGENEIPGRVINITERAGGVFTVPMALNQSESLRIRVSGVGDSEIFGYSIEYQDNV